MQAAKDVVPGWQYLPYQAFANSVFGDTVGQAYAERGRPERRPRGLAGASIVEYGNEQGFTVNE